MFACPLLAILALQPVAIQNDPRLQDATRSEKSGWVSLHLQGNPSAIGYQYGYLAAPEIDDAIKMLKGYLAHSTQQDWSFFKQAAEKMYWPKVDPEYQEEIKGIADGMQAKGYSYDSGDILAENSWIELAWYYLPYLKSKMNAMAERSKAPGYCSAFVATGDWTKDGRPVMAHNAWIDYIIGERWNFILDVRPDKGNRYLMDTFPGFIDSGDDFAINSNGIMVTETTITGFLGFSEDGIPEFDRAIKAVQYANNLDDFVRIMETGNNGGYANTWLVADNKTNEVGQLELGLKNVMFNRSNNGYFVGSNFPQNPKLIAQEEDPHQWPAEYCLDRHARWNALLAQYKGKIDASLGEQFLGDHYDEDLHKEGASGTTLCGHFDLDSRHNISDGWVPDGYPAGASQGKVVTAALADKMSFWARMGHPCGEAFYAQPLLQKHPEFSWLAPYLKDMPSEPWTLFTSK